MRGIFALNAPIIQEHTIPSAGGTSAKVCDLTGGSPPTSCHSDQSPRSIAGSETNGQRQPLQVAAGPCMVQPDTIVCLRRFDRQSIS